MKLIEKIKDLFMDEVVEDEEDEEQVTERETKEYREPHKDVLPKVMRETIKKEEKRELDVKPEKKGMEFRVKPEDFAEYKKENTVSESQKKFNFPIDFENDLPSRNNKSVRGSVDIGSSSNVNVLKIEKEATKKVAELYPKKEEEKIKPKFKASPVISPVYGVLDKNYTKEEVKERAEEMVEMKRPSKKVDFETVRKKAFGNLADDIKDNLMCENCELYKEVKKISALREDDLLYDMTVDDEKEVTIEKAYDNYEEFGVAYEPKVEKKQFDLEEEKEPEEVKDKVIDSNKQDEESYDDVKEEAQPIINSDYEEVKEESLEHEDEDKMDDDNEEEKIPSREEKKKEAKVDADFFELIDSMYKERTDD